MKRLLIPFILLLTLISAMPAQAHDPHFETSYWDGLTNPFVVPTDPTVSFAMYGYLDTQHVDGIALDFKYAGDKLQAQLLVPVCGLHYTDFYPQMAVVGPGLPAPDNTTVLPFTLPPGMGIQVVTMNKPDANGQRPTLHEDIGNTTFYTAPEVDLNVTVAARYYVLIWGTANATGDYAVATGYREEAYSPLIHTLNSIVLIRSGKFLHRDCKKDPGDPSAIIQPNYSTVLDATPTAVPAASATLQATIAATAS